MSYEFNMVDMGGIDLATANGTVVDGLYNKLLEGIDACGNLILYNWKFAEIEIAPSSCTTLKESSSIVINGLIEVTEQDEVTVLGIAPPPAPVEPLVATANGVYTAQSPVSGFNPVSVNVPIPHPRLIPITIFKNDYYTPPPGVDGFNSVTVNTPGMTLPESAQTVFSGSTANYEIPNSGMYAILIVADGYSNVDITASLASENIFYTDKRRTAESTYRSCGVVFIAECSAGDLLTVSASDVARQGLYVVHFATNVSIEDPVMAVVKDEISQVTISTDDFVFCMAASTGDWSPSCEILGWRIEQRSTNNYIFLQGIMKGPGSIKASGRSYSTNVSFAMKIHYSN